MITSTITPSAPSLVSGVGIAAFATVSFLIAISPGPSWIYVITARVCEGRLAGRFAILGNATGILIHAIAVAAGVATLLSISRAGFTALQWLGAAYLIYLGIKVLRRDPIPSNSELHRETELRRSSGRVYREAILMAILNPKISLLMLALLPQFVNPALGGVSLQILGLGALHIVIASSVLTVVATTAGSLTGWLERSARGRLFFRALNGSLLIAFGIGLALARRG